MDKFIDIDDINKQIKKQKIPISEISEKTGYSRTSIYRYLKKERLPTIDFINKILEIIG